MLSTPVAYFVFNRPVHTRKTFSVIRQQAPEKLFVIADGPRPGNSTDIERCREVRSIVGNIDWPCKVYRNYAEENMGLKNRMSSGLDWVFEHVEKAIVLEDDCLPHTDFFAYCESLLDHYSNNEKVWVVTGDNFQNGRKRGRSSYYFSRFNHCWGWATWRRAWQHFQGDLSFWPAWKNSADWKRKFPDPIERQYWERIFNKVEKNEIDSWAYPWSACVWYHGGLTATPNVNLVTNIGIGAESTHTKSGEDNYSLRSSPLGKITHPRQIGRDKKADRYVSDYHYGCLKYRFSQRFAGLFQRFKNVLRRS